MTGPFRVEHPCPQCGGPVTVEEADRLFQCGHCRVRLYIAGGGVPRYCLPHDSSLAGEDLVYVPYWHLRGIYYDVAPPGTKGKVVDQSFRALDFQGMPPSLGLRAQAMTLSRAAAGKAGRFLRPSLGRDSMVERAEGIARAFSGLPGGGASHYRTFIGETVSLVYSPVALREGKVCDAVLNRPLFPFDGERWQSMGPLDAPERWKTPFLPALCPNCGWDLPGESRSVVLTCPQCRRAWEAEGPAYSPVGVGTAGSGGEGGVNLPFWAMAVEVSGAIRLRSRLDLVRFANLPVAPREEWGGRDVFFWAPAFRASPRLLTRLCAQVTAVGPGFEEGELPSGGENLPATFGREAARESVRLTMADMGVPPAKVLPRLQGTEITCREVRLVYLPFEIQGGDLVHRTFRFSVRRSELRG